MQGALFNHRDVGQHGSTDDISHILVTFCYLIIWLVSYVSVQILFCIKEQMSVYFQSFGAATGHLELYFVLLWRVCDSQSRSLCALVVKQL